MAERKKYCVDGKWRESTTDTYIPVTDSSTGEVIAEVPRCTRQEVEEAITSAQEAFGSWSGQSLSKRVQYMFTWRDVLVEHLDELTELCAREHGKNMNESRGDILKAIEPTELACSLPLAIQGSGALQVTTGFDCTTYRKPLGVIGGIVPFNFPAMIPWGWMVPLAIACGNTVVLKAATPTPLTAMRILELFYEEAGFPKGVVNLVTCTHNESELLLTDPRVKAVTFVGTTRVGKQIYAQAGVNGKRVQAQTEAKNHALVLADCDLDATTSAIVNSAFGCAGERCMALPAVCVQEEIADELVDMVVKKAAALRIGRAYDPDTELGPVVSAAHKERVEGWIQKGIDEGATLALDGRNPEVPEGCENGYFIGATVFDNVTEDMTIGHDEIFGPVLSIKRVKDFDEGIAIMNANPFANGSSIFTQDGYFARRFQMETDGGMVGINVGIPVPSAYYPFSGNKDSFFGDQHVLGIDGYRFYTRATTVTTHWFAEGAKPAKKLDFWEGTVERL
ncbi:CoA-acylating methylmalonate-semialdehyde dehydrogenase [Propionibacterium australiense]|uniref:Aldehyde dehydrogenase family n=1 Tax=Propionibacterium australiense TaxID=119981 RepID=A0A383S5H4_9ACTN|nr:CoA-acylating methylmalonate-semialdehyde dehydrogenase [Propionibacterium australiense]RLP09760.1 methylmalonate-semialdehyde dehydrogenase (CoA acylating) [Propionibacterium australiense]SYZ33235.1 Aldehyde dehydrogenase family [Propionibacterium australiense]VEH89271.1 Methylmalonate semialdehyde dehydrogenase [acylating] [Propionibacterium australiense]